MATECIYCGQMIENDETLPQINDSDAWEKLATEHAPDCGWIRTRAHQRPDVAHVPGCSCGSPDCPEWQAAMLGQ